MRRTKPHDRSARQSTMDASAERAELANRLADVLAKLVCDSDEASRIARRAGFPAEHLPAFNTGATFWHAVVQQAMAGRIAPEALAAVAVEALPHNTDLRELEAAIELLTRSGSAPRRPSLRLGGRIHVCHAPEDVATAEAVVAALRDAGLAPWVTRAQLLPKDTISEHLDEAVREASYVVLLLSCTSLGSRWATLDWTSSLEPVGGVLIPVRVDDCDLPPLPLGTPSIDLGAGDATDGLSRLVDFFRREVDEVSFPTVRAGDRRALHGATRRELRLVAKHCLDGVTLDEFLFDADIDPGMVDGQSVHARVIWLLHRTATEGILEFFAEWLEGEKKRCVTHRLATIRSAAQSPSA